MEILYCSKWSSIFCSFYLTVMTENDDRSVCDGVPQWILIPSNDTFSYMNDVVLCTVNVPSCLRLCFFWKPGCHCSCYQNTFPAKTVQYSALQSCHYWLFDWSDSSADICCMAFDDSPHPWFLRPSGWNALCFYCVSRGLRRMVLGQYHPDQLWPPLRARKTNGVPYIHDQEK